MTKNTLIVDYAKALAAKKEADAFMEANKAAVIEYLEKNQNSLKTEYGTLILKTSSGAREIDSAILDKVSPEIGRRLVKPQVGLANKLIKSKELDQKLVDKYTTVAPDKKSVQFAD
jgi:uncharacterized LabA/DUF88 family protein